MMFWALHRNIRIRLVVGFVFGVTQSTTFPFMAIYFAKSVGEATAGVLLTVATLASLLAGLIGGYYCDKIGRRKLMIFGEAVFFVSYLLMAAANSPWWSSAWVTFLTFLTGQICWGVYGPADEAMLLDITTPETRTTVFGMFYWLHNLTMAIGASIGAFLFESHRFLLFGLTGGAVFITLMSTVLFIQETYQRPSHSQKPHHKHPSMTQVYHKVFTDKIFVLYFTGGVLLATLEFQLNNYIGIHLASNMVQETFHWFHRVFTMDGINAIGLLQTENTVLVVLLATAAVRFAAGHNRRQVLLWGITFNAIGFVAMTMLTTPIALLAAMLLATIGEVINVPVRQAYMGELAPEDMRSSYVAVNGMSYGGARMLASLAVILGAVIPNWAMGGLSAVFGLVGILCIWKVAQSLQPFSETVVDELSA